MSDRFLHRDSPWLLALLATLVALGPLSVDMYIPALPSMMVALDTNISAMHLTLSTYLAGFAIFHLACGPLADRIGRKPVLLGGTALFVGACVGCSLSTTVEELMLWRFMQGVGACVGPTIARTIARDVFGPTDAARALSLIAMLMALAPAIAPTLGGILLNWLPWPSIFVFLAVYGAATIALVFLYLEESLPQKQSLHPAAIARNFALLLRDRTYLTATLGSGMIYAGLLTYISASSFVYIDMLGVPVQYFGFIFLSSVIGYMCGSALSARLAQGQNPELTVLRGAMLTVTSCTAMLIGGFAIPENIWVFIVPMAVYSAGMGLVLPNAMAVALRHFPHIAGTASAMLGFIQMTLSGSATALIGLFLVDTPYPMMYCMFLITAVAMLLTISLYRQSRD